MLSFRFLAKDTRFDVVTGKECDRKPKQKQRAKSEREIFYLDGIPYKRIPIGPGNYHCIISTTKNVFMPGTSLIHSARQQSESLFYEMFPCYTVEMENSLSSVNTGSFSCYVLFTTITLQFCKARRLDTF